MINFEVYAPEETPYQIARGPDVHGGVGETYTPEIWKRVDGTYAADIYTGDLSQPESDYIRLGAFPTLDEAMERIRTWHAEQSA